MPFAAPAQVSSWHFSDLVRRPTWVCKVRQSGHWSGRDAERMPTHTVKMLAILATLPRLPMPSATNLATFEHP